MRALEVLDPSAHLQPFTHQSVELKVEAEGHLCQGKELFHPQKYELEFYYTSVGVYLSHDL